jgi:hypothetical protein
MMAKTKFNVKSGGQECPPYTRPVTSVTLPATDLSRYIESNAESK